MPLSTLHFTPTALYEPVCDLSNLSPQQLELPATLYRLQHLTANHLMATPGIEPGDQKTSKEAELVQNHANEAELPPYNYQSSVDLSDDDGVIIPKGSLDPVYEAKAKVVNKAVSPPTLCAR